MEYKAEDVKGYRVDGELVCINCVTAEDDEGLQSDGILTENDFEDDGYYFCDRCNKRM